MLRGLMMLLNGGSPVSFYSGRVAQLDEHKPSKFADAGSNPVTIIVSFL